jgi:type I restriction enzyme S subunit
VSLRAKDLNDWSPVGLGEIIQLKYGKGLKAADRMGGGIPVFGSGGVVGFHDTALVRGPGIVLGRKGTVGAAYWSEGDFYPIDTTYFVETQQDLRFIYYLLSTLTFEDSHAAVPGLSRETAYAKAVLLPPIEQQRLISATLRIFDLLIENNRRRIDLLEETARLLYREWFVNFRYPGHEDVPLVDSQLGPIPEGWNVTSLEQRACLTRSAVTPSDFPLEMFDHFSLPAFDEKSEPAVELGESIKSNKYLLDGECVLFSKLNPGSPRIWWAAPFITERRALASTEFLVLTENGGWRLPFIYSVVGSELFSLTMAARANGTSNSHQRVAPSDVMTYPILDPEDSIQERFSELVEPFLQLKSELIIQNRSLTQTRDLLLPGLVSGDLDVSDLNLDLEAVG